MTSCPALAGMQLLAHRGYFLIARLFYRDACKRQRRTDVFVLANTASAFFSLHGSELKPMQDVLDRAPASSVTGWATMRAWLPVFGIKVHWLCQNIHLGAEIMCSCHHSSSVLSGRWLLTACRDMLNVARCKGGRFISIKAFVRLATAVLIWKNIEHMREMTSCGNACQM